MLPVCVCFVSISAACNRSAATAHAERQCLICRPRCDTPPFQCIVFYIKLRTDVCGSTNSFSECNRFRHTSPSVVIWETTTRQIDPVLSPKRSVCAAALSYVCTSFFQCRLHRCAPAWPQSLTDMPICALPCTHCTMSHLGIQVSLRHPDGDWYDSVRKQPV